MPKREHTLTFGLNKNTFSKMRHNRNSWKTSSNTNQLVKAKISKTKQMQIISQEKKSIRKDKGRHRLPQPQNVIKSNNSNSSI